MQINNQVKVYVDVYLDKRYKKKNGKYPFKIRVHNPELKKTKMYTTVFEFTDSEYYDVWITDRPKPNNRKIKTNILKVVEKAESIIQDIPTFNFDLFEKKFYRKSSKRTNVFTHLDEIIAEFSEKNQISTASIYESCKNSIIKYLENKKLAIEFLSFSEINESWLENYEKFMIDEKEKSISTVSIYTRHLRATFNKAIFEGDISPTCYPFSKNKRDKKYKIPAVRKVKKYLTEEQLKLLFEMTPKTKEQEIAKDFWFLMYLCNGLNIGDLLSVEWGEISGNNLVYYREKIKNTSRGNLKPVIIFLTDMSLSLIEKHGTMSRKPKDFVFSILSKDDSPIDKKKKIKNFTRMINQNLQKLTEDTDLPSGISSNWARHSFATQAIINGGSFEFVGNALNHGLIETTKNYVGGFPDSIREKILGKLSLNLTKKQQNET